jgi:hypothetical protein
MNLFYAVWDFSERRLFPREHPSCAEHLAMSMGLTPGGELGESDHAAERSVGDDLDHHRERLVRCVALRRHAVVPGTYAALTDC